MENNPMNVRSSSFGVNSSNIHGGYGFIINKTPQYNYSLIHPPSINQLLLNSNHNSMGSLRRGGSFSAAPPFLYSTLPLHHQQPPLLPLPLKSASLPSPKPTKSKNRKKKSQKPKVTEVISKPVEKLRVVKEEEEDTEEEFLIGSPSSVLSPPPSSLPLPRLLLIKIRSSKASVDAGAATGDLRKLV